MPTVYTEVGKRSAVSIKTNRHSQNRRRSDVAVPACFRNRPSPVRVAIYRVWERSADFGFTRATTRVLQAIIAAGVSAHAPFAPVFAKKATLAKLADCSEVTVYRALNQLEKEGWINREHQERLDDGLLDVGNIQITEKLALLLGFIDCANPELPSIDDNNEDQLIDDPFRVRKSGPEPECAYIESPHDVNAEDSPSLQPVENPENDCVGMQMKDGLQDGSIYRGEQKVYPKASVNYQSTRSQFVRMDGRSVAQELVWLITEKRLTYGQLFKLQNMAKQVPGQQLSDFVSYRSERLKQLATTNDCYRYLKKFIDDGIDARYLCSQRAKQQHRVKRSSQRKQLEDAVYIWAKAFDGRTLISKTTGKAYLIHAQSGTIELVCDGVPKNSSMKLDRRFMRAVHAGKLTPLTVQQVKVVIAEKPISCQRTEDEYQRAESSIATMKAMLAKSSHKFHAVK